LALLGRSWGALGALLAALGVVLERSWGVLRQTWAVLERTWAVSGAVLDDLGAAWGCLGAALGVSLAALRRSWDRRRRFASIWDRLGGNLEWILDGFGWIRDRFRLICWICLIFFGSLDSREALLSGGHCEGDPEDYSIARGGAKSDFYNIIFSSKHGHLGAVLGDLGGSWSRLGAN
jgi:hypothetical protein